jgi:hypothetical protein
VLHREPLYQPADGHFQFKYLPVFAVGMAPFAMVDEEAAKAMWFALSAGLLTAFLRWSVRGLPERRRSERALLWLTALFMLKFYAHELTLGQTNILLGVLMMGGCWRQVDQCRTAAVRSAWRHSQTVRCSWSARLLVGGRGRGDARRAAAGLVLPAVFYGWAGSMSCWRRGSVPSRRRPRATLGADNISLAAMGEVARHAQRYAGRSTGALHLVAVAWVRRQRIASGLRPVRCSC